MKTRWQHGGNVYEIQRQYGIDHQKVLDFSANINPLGFPKGLPQAIAKGMDDLLHYPDPDYTDLSAAIAEANGIEPSWVYPGNGAIELIYMVMEFLRPDKAHVMAPGFVEYERSLRRYRSEVNWIRLKEEDDFQLTAQLIEPVLGIPGEPLVLCSPNNPTGALIEPALLRHILDKAHEAKQPVVLDEAFIEFVESGDALHCVKEAGAYPLLFVLRSMTKCFAIPGLRLGYLVTSSPDFSEWVQEYRIPWMVNHLAEVAGQAALQDPEHLKNTRAYVAEQRRNMIAAMEKIKGLKTYPAEANFICLRLDDPTLDLKAALVRYGIMIRSCANYIGMDQRFYRVAVRKESENRQLLDALDRVINGG